MPAPALGAQGTAGEAGQGPACREGMGGMEVNKHTGTRARKRLLERRALPGSETGDLTE